MCVTQITAQWLDNSHTGVTDYVTFVSPEVQALKTYAR